MANAMGHLLIAAASEGPDALWDLLSEFGKRTGTEGPTIHALLDKGGARYCVHPDSRLEVEFRADDLREALLSAAAWKARVMPADLVWERR